MRSESVLTRGASRLKAIPGAVPPAGLVFLGILSVQVGASFAKGLFPALGPLGTVFLRLAFAALILLIIWRPRVRGQGYTRNDFLVVILFGIIFAVMNSSFYAALDRVPLGVAVTVEFVGPLGVAIFGSRRKLDLLWAGLATAGILLLSPITGVALDPAGVGFALLAGACWAAYILLGVRVGRAFPGGSGLAISMTIGAVVAAPLGIWQGGNALLDPVILLTAAAVALLSSVIPYSLELEALRKLPAHVFGVLMSAEPATAAVVGFLVLGEALGLHEIVAIVLITAASAGATRYSASDHGAAEITP